MPPKRRNSYTTALKLEVIKYSEENRNRLSACEYQIDETNIRRWRKEKNVLEVINPRKRARRGRKPFWPQLEIQLKDWVLQSRADNRQVSTVKIRFEALRMVKDFPEITGFKAGINW
jgi:hypothetical protein